MSNIEETRMERNPDEILRAIADSDMWVVFTVKKVDNGATLSVRQSSKEAMVNAICLLLEEKDIYERVQAKIAEAILMDKKKGKKTIDPNVN